MQIPNSHALRKGHKIARDVDQQTSKADLYRWARSRTDRSKNERDVLIALIRCSNSKGCTPSYAKIAAMAEISRTTAYRCLKELQRDGVIAIEHRRSHKGRQATSTYVLHTAQPPPPECQIETLAQPHPEFHRETPYYSSFMPIKERTRSEVETELDVAHEHAPYRVSQPWLREPSLVVEGGLFE